MIIALVGFADVVGPAKAETIAGKPYALIWRDDFSRFPWACSTRYNGGVPRASERFLADVRAGDVDTLRTDSGGEFTSDSFDAVCDGNRIRRELTNVKRPRLEWCRGERNSNSGCHAESG